MFDRQSDSLTTRAMHRTILFATESILRYRTCVVVESTCSSKFRPDFLAETQAVTSPILVHTHIIGAYVGASCKLAAHKQAANKVHSCIMYTTAACAQTSCITRCASTCTRYSCQRILKALRATLDKHNTTASVTTSRRSRENPSGIIIATQW